MHIDNVESTKSGKRPTRDDVASVANLSGATVWRVLSGRDDVSISPETRQRVLDAAEQLGYRPNAAARALLTGKSQLVGFWMSLSYSRYRAQVLDYMRGLLGRTELAMAVTDVDEEYHWDHTFTRALRVPVDGIIAFDTSASGETFARNHRTLAPSTPFVSMGAYWSDAMSFVGVDLQWGAEAAMDHLLSSGRRRIAYLAPSNSGLLTEGIRYNAYKRKMEAAGLPLSLISVPGSHPDVVAAALDLEFKGGNVVPEAILCMNDDSAIAVVLALQSQGIRVGPDTAVVGFDGIAETEYGPTPITTVRQPIEEMCTLAWQFLKAQMDDPEAPLQQTILKPKLVIRDSSKP